MVTTKGDYVFVDEELSKVQISCGRDVVKITLFNALDWQAVAYFRRMVAAERWNCRAEDRHE